MYSEIPNRSFQSQRSYASVVHTPDLQPTFENLVSLGTADGDMNRDLFIPTDTEGSDGVASFTVDRVCP